jgi:hypothetical protein
MFGSILKAAVGVVTLPVAVVKDTITIGGALIDEESAIIKNLKAISDNTEKAVDPDTDIMD